MMDEQIRQLDDASALRMLSVITDAHQVQAKETTPSRELVKAMDETLGGQCEATHDPNDGEAARMALILLAGEECFRGPIEAMLEGPAPERMAFGVVESTLLAAGLILALQTYFKIEYKEGHLHVKIKKKPTSNTMLTPLVKKLLSITGR